MAKTLVLSPRYTPDSIALSIVALEMGWTVERLQSWRPPTHLCNREVVPYGEPLFAAVVADTLQLVLIEPRLSWVAEIPFDLRQRNVQFTNFATARTQDHRSFIKPADDKCFPARVYESGTDLPSGGLEGSTPVLISDPVSWEIEFRCFVLEQQIAALSIYSRKGELAEDEYGNWPAADSESREAAQFANRVLHDARLGFPPAGVLDIGIIQNRGWAVVEANACWGAGVYGCDPRRVLETLSRACRRKNDLSESDRPWIVDRSQRTA
jgi:hypothetical protein